MINQLANNLLGIAEIGGNHLLSMDEHALIHCQELQGCVIAFELIDLDKTLYCHPGNWGLRLSLQPPAKEVDATIKGRLMGLVSLSLNRDKLSTSIQERVEIIGNAKVAQKFQKLLSEIDIDWQEQLSKITGDIMAFRIGQGVQKTHDWITQSFNSFALSSREYLQEETRGLPTKVEFEHFRNSVTTTRDDVDRLEALLDHFLQQKTAKNKKL